MKLCMLFLEAEAPCSRRGLAPDCDAEALQGFCSKPGHIDAMCSPGKGGGWSLGAAKISLKMYVEETGHLCSYVILNLDETWRHMRCLTRAGPQADAPREMGACRTWPGLCSPHPACPCSLCTLWAENLHSWLSCSLKLKAAMGDSWSFSPERCHSAGLGLLREGTGPAQGAARQGPERPNTAGVKAPQRSHNPSLFSWGTQFLPSLKSLT